MNTAESEEAPDIRTLQSMATEAAATIGQKKGRKLSRRAQLHLIDQLSRFSGAGLGLLGGVAVFLAVTIGRTLPLRAAIWMAMVAATLYVARRFRRQFRAGELVAAKPFRWRTNYTASASVLAAAFGAGSWLLFPLQTATDLAIFAIIPATLVVAAAAHAPHFSSFVGVAAGGMLFTLPALFRASDAASATSISALTLAALCVCAAFSLHLRKEASARFPRTSSRRDQIELLEPRSEDYGQERRFIAS